MKFLVVSHVIHSQKGNQIYGYGPYTKEMNLWFKYVDKVRIIAPMGLGLPDPIDLPYVHSDIQFDKVPSFNLLTMATKLKTLFLLPYIFFKVGKAMLWADHIHLRCPGNMGLIGAVAQLFFPWKIKTVKYAGNWDPKSAQPATYRLQKSILSNPTISKKTTVLVYGKWPHQTKNIKEFFTASYKDEEKQESPLRPLTGKIKLVFVGALSSGKQPMIAIKAAHELIKMDIEVHLDLMGEGEERKTLESYIEENKLGSFIVLHGNQSSEFVKQKFRESHFLILMSKSEGWPKVVAEAMFWGSVPIASNVSCVNYMMGEGSRGSLVSSDALSVVNAIKLYIKRPNTYQEASENAMKWSRQFTLESFEYAIKEVLHEA